MILGLLNLRSEHKSSHPLLNPLFRNWLSKNKEGNMLNINIILMLIDLGMILGKVLVICDVVLYTPVLSMLFLA